jgi:hypothetical protein
MRSLRLMQLREKRNAWYNDIKPRVCRLAGWESHHRDPLLHTRAAYDVAYDSNLGFDAQMPRQRLPVRAAHISSAPA